MKFTSRTPSEARGFTLMEVLIVMTLMGISLLVVLSIGDISRTEQAGTRATAEKISIETALGHTLGVPAICALHFADQPALPGLNTTDFSNVQDMALDLFYADNPTTLSSRAIVQRNSTRMGPFLIQSVGIQLTGNPSGRQFTGNLVIGSTATGKVFGSQTKAISMPMSLTLNDADDRIKTCQITPTGSSSSDNLPSGAVMAFDLDACPSGWSEFENAKGRLVIGSGTRNFVDDAERDDWNWWNTAINSPLGAAPANVSYPRGTLHGSLFHTQYKEQMAKHWHYVLNTHILSRHLGPGGNPLGMMFLNSPIAHSGMTTSNSGAGGAGGGGGGASVSVGQEISAFQNNSTGSYPGTTRFPSAADSSSSPTASSVTVFGTGFSNGAAANLGCTPGTCSYAGGGHAHLQLDTHSMDLPGSASFGFVPFSEKGGGGNGDGSGRPPHRTPIFLVPPPGRPPIDPWGRIYYDSTYGAFYSFSTSGCSSRGDASVPCQPPGYPYFAGEFAEGDGSWSSRGNFVLPPSVALLYCKKD